MKRDIRGVARSRARSVFAWVVAIISGLISLLVAIVIGSALRVPMHVDIVPYTVHYLRGGEEEVNSATTLYGWGVTVLTVLFSVIAWHVVQGSQFSGIARARLRTWATGGLVLAVGGILHERAFRNATGIQEMIGSLTTLCIMAVAVLAARGVWSLYEIQPGDEHR